IFIYYFSIELGKDKKLLSSCQPGFRILILPCTPYFEMKNMSFKTFTNFCKQTPCPHPIPFININFRKMAVYCSVISLVSNNNNTAVAGYIIDSRDDTSGNSFNT